MSAADDVPFRVLRADETGATDPSRLSIPVASAADGKLLAIEHTAANDYLDDFVIGLDGLCGIGSQQQQIGALSGLNGAYFTSTRGSCRR
jgi:hypothetical protein